MLLAQQATREARCAFHWSAVILCMGWWGVPGARQKLQPGADAADMGPVSAQIVKPFAQEAADKAVPAAKELSEGAQLMWTYAHTCECSGFSMTSCLMQAA